MPVVVQCPKCQAKLRGPDELAGKSVRCKGCREKFRIPGTDAGLDSMTETQQLSVVKALPSVAVATPFSDAFVPAALPPPGTAANPLPLDDLMLEELPAAKPPTAGALDAADLLEEPAPKPSADPFSFEEPAPDAVRKKKRRPADDEDDEDRPRKRRRPDEDDEKPVRRAYQKKNGAPWGLLIGVLVVLLAVGGGLAAVFLLKKDAKEEAKAKPKAKAESPTVVPPKAKGEPTPGEGTPKPDGGGPKQPSPPPKKNETPPPAMEKLPAAPTGKLTVVGKASHQLALTIPTYLVRDIRVAGSSVVVAFNSQPGFQGAGVQDTIRQYSAKTGAAGREFVIDSSGLTSARGFAVSGDGELVAVEAGGPGRVTVFDFETNTTLLDKADVFADRPDRVGPVAGLAFGSGRKLFVVDRAGAVDVWDLATGARTVTGVPPKRTAAPPPAAKACAISGGKAVAVALDNKVWAVDVAGKMTGTGATLPAPDAIPLAVGAGPGDDRAAVVYRLPNGRFGVAAVHPVSGAVEYHTVLPEGAGTPVSVGWPDATILSVSTGQAAFLIDTEERAVTAYLKGRGGAVNLFPTGGELWWLTADATDAKKSTLLSADPRFDSYPALAKQARATRQSVYLVPGPGGLAK